ncbi:MAG TPA: mechanosensitive ion channel domain-containing protein, partial [Elusimicrobiota bacterium]|nr:mechanosensitive ion channel domain-containing protein [Elusimicrobiota bacterium]
MFDLGARLKAPLSLLLAVALPLPAAALGQAVARPSLGAPAAVGFVAPGLAAPAASFAPLSSFEPASVASTLPSLDAAAAAGIGAAAAPLLFAEQPVIAAAPAARPDEELPFARSPALSAPSKRAREPREPRARAAASSREGLRAAGELSRGESRASLPSWNRFWSGAARSSDETPEPVAAASLGAPRARLAPAPELGAFAAAPFFSGLERFKVLTPHVQAGGVLLATYAVSWAARRALSAVWGWKGWDRGSLVLARLGSNFVVWTAGIIAAMKASGLDWTSVFTGLGIGSIAVSLALKEFLGNFIHGVVILLNRPFSVGERIRVGDVEYIVSDMTFHDLILREGAGDFTLMTYSQVQGKTITLFRPWTQGKGGAPAAEQAAHPAPRAADGKGFLLRFGLVAAIAAAGFWMDSVAAGAAPYFFAGATFGAAWTIERLVSGYLLRFAERKGWRPHVASLVRLGVSASIYLLGAGAAMALAGVSWAGVLGTAGFLGVSIGIAATEVISNLIQAGRILWSHAFVIGDRIEIATKAGRVADVTLNYVVLQGDAQETILVPYSA